MALAPNTIFETRDPDALADDLRTEHRDVRDEILRVEMAAPKRWATTYVGDNSSERAVRDRVYAGAGAFTVFTPGKPQNGDSFRVLSAGLANVTVMSDDGKLIQGVTTPDVWLAVGWREYQYVANPLDARLQGWWHNA